MPAESPLCGMAACSNRATRADPSGVGYCYAHGRTFPKVSEDDPFDTWWVAACRGNERGDVRWEGLEYGEWPEEAPDAP